MSASRKLENVGSARSPQDLVGNSTPLRSTGAINWGHFIGHTRFSLLAPDSPSWRLSRETKKASSFEDYKNALFDERRLTARADIFLNNTLPILDIARRQHELIHVVSYSNELPDEYRSRLEEAAAQYCWLKLDPRDDGASEGLSSHKLVRQNFKKGTHYGFYRLDDDDILSSSYFDQASRYLKEPFQGMVLSLARGVQAFYKNGEFLSPRIEHRPKIALGLMGVCYYTDSGKIVEPKSISHTKTDLANPVILDSSEISYVHTMHATQDSGIAKPDDDFERRLYNYLRQESLGAVSVKLEELFPSVAFTEATAEQITSLIKPQSGRRRDLVRNTATSLVTQLKRKWWSRIH